MVANTQTHVPTQPKIAIRTLTSTLTPPTIRLPEDEMI
nr:MAG TPA: hypothetical protein [Caudoviricetes sp.]